MKKCNTCGELKDTSEFSKKNKGADGTQKYQSKCKTCHSAYLKVHYSNNKQYYKDKATTFRNDFAEFYKSLKSQLKCEVCGESHSACLEFHHVDQTTKDGEVANIARRHSKRKLLAEIAKCKVLCANCHRKHHAGDLNI